MECSAIFFSKPGDIDNDDCNKCDGELLIPFPDGREIKADDLLFDDELCKEFWSLMEDPNSFDLCALCRYYLDDTWEEFLNYLKTPLEIDKAVKLMGKEYVDNIGLSRGLRTLYWNGLLELLTVSKIIPIIDEADYLGIIEQEKYLEERIQKDNPEFTPSESSDVGYLDNNDFLYWIMEEYRQGSSDLKKCLAFATYYLLLK